MNFTMFGGRIRVKKNVDHICSLQFKTHQFSRSYAYFTKQNMYHNNKHTHIYILFNFTFSPFLQPFPGGNVHIQ